MDEMMMMFMGCTTVIFCFGCLFGFELQIGEKKISINGARIGKPLFREAAPSSSASEKELERLEERVAEIEIELKMKKEEQ